VSQDVQRDRGEVGPKYSASSSTCWTARADDSCRASVVLPDPVLPRTRIRSHPRTDAAGSRDVVIAGARPQDRR
jgi:hypothetical protein